MVSWKAEREAPVSAVAKSVTSAYDAIAGIKIIDRFAGMASLSPRCPTCGKPVPFFKTQWGLGKPFACHACETRLIIPKNLWIGLGAFVVFWLLKDRMASPTQTVMLIVGLVAAILIMSRLFLRPQKA